MNPDGETSYSDISKKLDEWAKSVTSVTKLNARTARTVTEIKEMLDKLDLYSRSAKPDYADEFKKLDNWRELE